jgi:hypothetical protein
MIRIERDQHPMRQFHLLLAHCRIPNLEIARLKWIGGQRVQGCHQASTSLPAAGKQQFHRLSMHYQTVATHKP